MDAYKVELEVFRGPLDLLLFLVKRHEVDICDIPIARIAEQFLEYLNLLQLVDMEWAGDFLVMAATLMEIKSRMLLPRPEELGEEEDDPRQELVKQLLEYKKFKEAAVELEAHAEKQLTRLSRKPLEIPKPLDPSQQPLHQVELWDLVSAFGRLMRETLALEPKQIVMDDTPQHVHMENIHAMVLQRQRVSFRDIFTPPHTRGRLLGIFLALLELIKGRKIRVEQESVFGNVWITIAPDPPPDLETANLDIPNVENSNVENSNSQISSEEPSSPASEESQGSATPIETLNGEANTSDDSDMSGPNSDLHPR